MMKKLLTFLCIAMLFFGIAGTASALVIDLTLPEFSSPDPDPGSYDGEYLVGTFNFDLMGEQIVSAEISGQWGNSINPTTAHNLLFADSLQVADTHDYTPDPYSSYFVDWSYTFTDFSELMDGVVNFSAEQTSQFVIRLGATNLTIETAPVPEPTTLILLGLGLLGITGISRRKN